MQHAQKNLNKWEIILISRMGKLNTIAMTMFPTLIYTFNTIITRIPADFFVEINKSLLEFMENYPGPKKAKSIIKKVPKQLINLFYPNQNTH